MEIKLTIYGNPVTKKNSQRIITIAGRPRIIPSANYKKYEKDAIAQLRGQVGEPEIDFPVNVAVNYFMQTRRRVDLVNLLEASLDILVVAKVLSDDNSNIVAKHDGCGVFYDKGNPRAEIFIREILPFEMGDDQ